MAEHKTTHEHQPVHPATHPVAAPRGPWYKNKRARTAGTIIGALFIVGFIFWLFAFMPFVSTDDARIDADMAKVANLGASGQIIKIYVKEGDKVTTGEVLAELDHTTAEAQLEKTTALASFAETDLKRTRAIASQQGLSQQQLDRSQQMASVTQADLRINQIALERTFIRSPVNGIVIQKNAEIGNILEANQTAFTVADTENSWVSANVLEKSVGDVKVGQDVLVSIDEGGALKGKVVDVRRAAASVFALIPSDNAAGNFTKVEQRIPVKIELEAHPNKELRVGQSVVIKIKIR
jgi:membrane fusion protein (multidrug efflux system)